MGGLLVLGRKGRKATFYTFDGPTSAGLDVIDVDSVLELVEVAVLEVDDVVKGIAEVEPFEVVARKSVFVQYLFNSVRYIREEKEIHTR